MLANALVTVAGHVYEGLFVRNRHPSPGNCKCAITLEPVQNAADITATYTKHRSKFILRERHNTVACPINRRENPFGCALFDALNCIAGSGLKHLRQQAVCISRKQPAQGRGSVFGRFNGIDWSRQEWTAKLDRDLTVGRKVAGTDNSTHRTLSTNQDRFNICTVAVCDKKRNQTWPQGKEHPTNVVPGPIEQL